MMIVWRIRGKIIRTVLCCIVYHSCTQSYAHSYERFSLVQRPVGLGLVSFCVCFSYFFLTRTRLFVIMLVILCFCVLFYGCCFVVSTNTINFLERTFYVSSGTLNSTHSLTSGNFVSKAAAVEFGLS